MRPIIKLSYDFKQGRTVKTRKEMIEPWVTLCRNIGQSHGVDPNLVMGIIIRESSGRPGAVRYEKGYPHLHEPDRFARLNLISTATEEIQQQHSFGLMQIMLATARWLGFQGYPKDLYDPAINIQWGVTYLSRLQMRYSSMTDVIAAYNAGSAKKDPLTGFYVNSKGEPTVQRYVDAVNDHIMYFKTNVIAPGQLKLS